jgi:hypothetical protein
MRRGLQQREPDADFAAGQLPAHFETVELSNCPRQSGHSLEHGVGGLTGFAIQSCRSIALRNHSGELSAQTFGGMTRPHRIIVERLWDEPMALVA